MTFQQNIAYMFNLSVSVDVTIIANSLWEIIKIQYQLINWNKLDNDAPGKSHSSDGNCNKPKVIG